jgi:hypothetical protein
LNQLSRTGLGDGYVISLELISLYQMLDIDKKFPGSESYHK